MILSIASGKGGTGKTTVATNIALSLSQAQLIDCDVEEPNAHVFLPVTTNRSENVTISIPAIDETRCTHCGACSKFCAYNALAILPNKVLIFPELCHSCTGCALVCPVKAVQWKEKTIGTLEHGHTDNIDFYKGLLLVGEIQAIPVLKTLKTKIDPSKNVILDAPPGTACPMIETISASDYCILVAEPTPFGLHDLKLAVEVVHFLHIPFGVIINRDGMGDDAVETYCKKQNIPILLKIPHDEQIAKLYSKGVAFVQEMPEWKEQFTQLFTKIKQEVSS